MCLYVFFSVGSPKRFTLSIIWLFLFFLFLVCCWLSTANLCVCLCGCVCVYLVWKIALNFYKGFPSYFMLQLLFILYFFFSLFRSVHIQKSSTGNQKRINTKIKMYHRFVHVLLLCERKTNKLEYSLRRQFVCIRRVRFFLLSLCSFYRMVRVRECICLKSARKVGEKKNNPL